MNQELLNSLTSLLTSNQAPERLTDADRQGLLRKGAVVALEQACLSQDGSEIASILAVVAVEALSPDIQEQAVSALGRCASCGVEAAAIELYRLAVESGIQFAADIIAKRELKPPDGITQLLYAFLFQSTLTGNGTGNSLSLLTSDDYAKIADFYLDAPDDTRQRVLAAARRRGLINWSLLLPALSEGTPEALATIVARYPTLPLEDRALTLHVFTRLSQTGSVPAQDALTELCIQYEDDQACTTVQDNGFTPTDPFRRAVYFFLMGDWAAYESVDFTHTLLPAAYVTASSALRHRLLAASRASGHIEWLSRGRPLFGLQDLTEQDWASVIQQLINEERWDDLLRLAFAAPPIWSAKILTGYPESIPAAQVEDQDDWHELTHLAGAALQLPITLTSELRLPGPESIAALAISPDERWLALAGAEAQIQLLNLPAGRMVPPISGPVARTQVLAFSADSSNLITSGAGHALRVFRLEDGQLVKTLSAHTAPVRALAVHPSGRAFFSAAFDGTVRAWRFPHGPEVNRLAIGGEVFGLVLVDGGSTLVASSANGSLLSWRWEDGNNTRELSSGGAPMTAVAGHIGGAMVAAYSRDRRIEIWNISSGRQTQVIPLPGSPLTTLLAIAGTPFLAAGFYDGSLAGFHSVSGQEIFRLAAYDHPVVGLAFLPASRRLASAAGEQVRIDSLAAVIDLRTPLEQLEAQDSSGSVAIPSAWRAFLDGIIRWKTRFDIRIDDAALIPVGEFDIQL